MTMKGKGYSRRAFLKLATAGAAGVGVVGWLRIGPGERVVVCSKCGAEFDEDHHYEVGPARGVYCPNCGVELARLEYDLRSELKFAERERGKSKEAKARWDYAQVPFPHPKLVRRTDKPAFVLSELKL